nr:TIGR00730 family Rossman fold protein [uncultured Cohaesibacter sp.]
MATLQKICVYCGSGCGNNPVFVQEARLLGQEMAKAGIGLVYGGGSVGLMGILAKSVLENGGHVTGIIPGFLKDREVMLADVQDLIITRDMHERKRKMFDAAQAFVALPGGIGTLEELVEMLTWAQLGQHKKPVLLANIEGFWDPLADLLDHMRDENFIRHDMAVSYLSTRHARDIVPMLREAVAGLPDEDIAATTLQDSLSTL